MESLLNRRAFLAASAGGLVSCAASGALAQPWPSRPLRIVCPAPVGGQTDLVARTLAEFFSRQLGQTVVVENKTGGVGVIGITEVKRAPADGYTLLYTTSGSLIQNRATIKDLPYDPEKDFTYLTTISGIGGLMVASKKTGAKNLKEFVAYAKRVGSVSFGAYGPGSMPHLVIEILSRQYGFKVETINYRGEAPMWADVAGQTLDGAAGSYAGALPLLQAGHGAVVGTVSGRLPTMPEVTSLAEQGAQGKFFETRAFAALAVPSATPKDIVKKLSDIAFQAGKDEKVKQVLSNYLLEAPTTLEAADQRMRTDSEVLLALLKDLNIRPE